jgi:hypothetical protein
MSFESKKLIEEQNDVLYECGMIKDIAKIVTNYFDIIIPNIK